MDARREAGTGRYRVKELDDELVAWGYWHAYLGDRRVNGGVCDDYTDGVHCAMQAIERAREQWLRDYFYWDHETCQWVKKGELPPVS
jgi:hypothetical protein